MDLIDITRSLAPTTAVWPGDQPVEWSWTARIEEGASVNLGAVKTSTHAGTHVDAPYHVRESGPRTEELELSPFVGPAEVISVEHADAIRPNDVSDVRTPRILFKTSASTVSTEDWPTSVAPVLPETAELLHEKGVTLIGTDAPSVDPLDSTSLPGHNALMDAGIVNIEGLNLESVPPGAYALLSLPMKLHAADAAPVRAVLGPTSLFD